MNNVLATWGDVFTESLQSVWLGFADFVPMLLVAVVLFVIGWVIGVVVAKAVEQVFAALKVDRALASARVDNVFRRAGMSLNSGYFVGQVVKWFIIVVFLIPSLNLLFGENNDVSAFLKEVLAYLPNVIVAALILVIASVLASAVSRLVMASTKAMNVESANMLGTIVKYAIWIFAMIIALSELGVATYYMGVLFTGVIAMLALAGGLAFGLGGRDAAARLVAKVSEESRRG